MLFDMLAQELGVSVEEFINKIESTTQENCEKILDWLWSEDPILIEKAKQLWKTL